MATKKTGSRTFAHDHQIVILTQSHCRVLKCLMVVEIRVFLLGGVPTTQLPPRAEAEGAGALPPRKAGGRAARRNG